MRVSQEQNRVSYIAMPSPPSGLYLSAARQRHICADPETPHASVVVNTSRRRSSVRPAFFFFFRHPPTHFRAAVKLDLPSHKTQPKRAGAAGKSRRRCMPSGGAEAHLIFSHEAIDASNTSASRTWGPCRPAGPKYFIRSELRGPQRDRRVHGQHNGRSVASTVCHKTSQNVTS